MQKSLRSRFIGRSNLYEIATSLSLLAMTARLTCDEPQVESLAEVHFLPSFAIGDVTAEFKSMPDLLPGYEKNQRLKFVLTRSLYPTLPEIVQIRVRALLQALRTEE